MSDLSAPPVPEDELGRLASLSRLGILDTDPEEAFDAITRLVKHRFGVAIALVSLVDDERQWFKSRCGLEATETGRDVAFCAHAIMSDETFEIPDATKDPRFADNPLVTGEPHIRYYAGIPIHTPTGHRVGTLCIIHTEPHLLSADERTSLVDVGRVVDELLAARWEAARAKRDRDQLDGVLHALAHDLRAPVRHVTQAMALLETRNPDEDPAPLLAIANRAVQRMHGQQSALLELVYALDSGPLGLVNARDALDAAWARVEHDDIDLEVVGELPSVPSAHPGIEEVLHQLLRNATEHDASQIHVEAVRHTLGWRFTIRDDGSGMADNAEDYVMRPFARLPADAPTNGIGLAICRILVAAAGGEVGFDSNQGEKRGTSVWFSWPSVPGILS